MDDYSKFQLAFNSSDVGCMRVKMGGKDAFEDAAEKRFFSHIESFRDARASANPTKCGHSLREVITAVLENPETKGAGSRDRDKCVTSLDEIGAVVTHVVWYTKVNFYPRKALVLYWRKQAPRIWGKLLMRERPAVALA